jgi:hypothetical protein
MGGRGECGFPWQPSPPGPLSHQGEGEGEPWVVAVHNMVFKHFNSPSPGREVSALEVEAVAMECSLRLPSAISKQPMARREEGSVCRMPSLMERQRTQHSMAEGGAGGGWA